MVEEALRPRMRDNLFSDETKEVSKMTWIEPYDITKTTTRWTDLGRQ